MGYGRSAALVWTKVSDLNPRTAPDRIEQWITRQYSLPLADASSLARTVGVAQPAQSRAISQFWCAGYVGLRQGIKAPKTPTPHTTHHLARAASLPHRREVG